MDVDWYVILFGPLERKTATTTIPTTTTTTTSTTTTTNFKELDF